MGERVIGRAGLGGLLLMAAVVVTGCLSASPFPVSSSNDASAGPAIIGENEAAGGGMSGLSPKAQYDLFRKVLFYERSMEMRTADDLVICIVYESGYDVSVKAKDELQAAIKDDPELGIGSTRFEAAAVDLDKIQSLGAALDAGKAHFLYIAPLGPKTMKTRFKDILRESQTRKIPTITGVLEYVDAGAAIGFGMGKDRPQIRVNLSASKAQGFVFSAQFLRRVGTI